MQSSPPAASVQSVFALAFLLAKWFPGAFARFILIHIHAELSLGLYDLAKSAESTTESLNNLMAALGDMEQQERAEFDRIVSDDANPV